ncbi:MAG: hypothetical protein JO295_01910 [Verrucomicrobia bacterium]|nr:hypothetical protein [Verrucomicrobiota bacterium]
MIDPDLLAILCCPETHQSLALADAATLERINTCLAPGVPALAAALLRADGRRAYPVRDNLPILLVEEGIAI